jgi:hypothetical protein
VDVIPEEDLTNFRFGVIFILILIYYNENVKLL